ncbi:MAG: helicase [Armatimonadota bacterium]
MTAPESGLSMRRHRIEIGGIAKESLLEALHAIGVELNPLARDLFADERFGTSAAREVVDLVETTVADLGLVRGGTMPDLLRAAADRGWTACPLEAGPHLRLQIRSDREEAGGTAQTRGCAPPGSITVVSDPIAMDSETPKGFYLRRIGGTPWLRGYRSDDHHVWSPQDRLIFFERSVRSPGSRG